MGYSVTQHIKTVKQPYGGYLPRKDFVEESLGEGIEDLYDKENIHPSRVGTVVDYMTRLMSGSSVIDAFKISLLGAMIINERDNALKLMSGIKGLGDEDIVNAAKLVGFDVCYRYSPIAYRPFDEINPDEHTIQNIRVMVQRSLHFLECYGPKVLDGFTLEGGYTDTVSAGDGDFITADTLWDFKVSKEKLDKDQTLQLLMYWRMGLHSIHPEFRNIKYLGIYNPRMNKVYRIAVEKISEDVICEVEKDVIGYSD